MRTRRDVLWQEHRTRATRGFTLMLVLSVLIFIPLAVVSMGALVAHDVRRTRASIAQTQLRQLLEASVPAAQAELAARGAAARQVPVETPVPSATLILTIAPGDQPSQPTSQVRAQGQYHGFRAAQVLVLARQPDGKWALRESRLVQTAGQ